MTTVHVYRAKDQPATRYKVTLQMPSGERTVTITNRRLKRMECFKCKGVRIAGNLIAHVYYDGIYYFCKPGKGCKS